MEFVGIVKENNSIDQGYIANYFSVVEVDRVYSKGTIESRKHTFLGILLLRQLMKNRLKREYSIHYPTLDKPILLGKDLDISSYDFSLSHSHELVCCIVSKDKVGIDVEKIRNVNFEIMPLVFTEDEMDFVLAKEADRNERFFEIWTRKESFIKLIGKGLTHPLKELNFVENNKVGQILNIDGDRYYFKKFRYKNYIISICSDNKIDVDLKILNESECFE